MDTADPNLPLIRDCLRLVDRIASCRSDETVKRAATIFGLTQAMQGFPVSPLSVY